MWLFDLWFSFEFWPNSYFSRTHGAIPRIFSASFGCAS
jgi:hypothetical protein